MQRLSSFFDSVQAIEALSSKEIFLKAARSNAFKNISGF